MNHSAGEHHAPVGFRYGQLRRRYRRAGVSGFVGDIADGSMFIGGMIEDISAGGFRMTHLPPAFGAEKHSYATVVSGGGKHYRLLAKPCWRRQGRGNSVEIGFKILDAPWEWLELTMKEIPEFDYEDFFGTTH